MRELVFATNNAHKLEEIQAIVGDRFKIRSLADIGCDVDIPETGVTFEENAKQKSDFIVQQFGFNCFGDDSGLEVLALDNAPGVYSARYSGSRDMEKNIDLLLTNLGDNEDRRARFRTVISLSLEGRHYFFEGHIDGTIIIEKRGTAGFGYDPIFIPSGYDKTFAEMSSEEKNSISHRSIATRKLCEFLANQ